MPIYLHGVGSVPSCALAETLAGGVWWCRGLMLTSRNNAAQVYVGEPDVLTEAGVRHHACSHLLAEPSFRYPKHPRCFRDCVEPHRNGRGHWRKSSGCGRLWRRRKSSSCGPRHNSIP